MKKFIPGLKLSKLYYEKSVKPILEKNFPRLKYSAALFGWGSEVLGYDTAVSSDHHWGPRVLIFLSEKDFPIFSTKISKALSENLPYEFMGYSTNFSEPQPNGVRHAVKIEKGTVNHMVNTYTIESFWMMRLKFNSHKGITTTDWLTFPQSRLLEMVSGEVFHDGLGTLTKTREKFSYFPKDIWLYLLASQWQRISQEEAFVGRTGDVGDELGSQVVASRLVKELMRLSFLMERKYYPYQKWFGTAFSKLSIAKKLAPVLRKIMLSKNWREREKELAKAYAIIAIAHNSLQITETLTTKATHYYGRPYLVIHADRFTAALKKEIKDKSIKELSNIGSVDQFTDSNDVSQNLNMCQKLEIVYK